MKKLNKARIEFNRYRAVHRILSAFFLTVLLVTAIAIMSLVGGV